MKKYLLSFAAMGAMLLAGCSNEVVNDLGNDGNVAFSVEFPAEMKTRAYADGTTAAQNVTCYVYDKSNTTGTPSFTESVPMSGLQGNVTFNLVSGRTYDFVFVAVGNASKVSYQSNGKTLNVDYSNIFGNDEELDAFFTTVQDFKVTGASQQTVTLKRPYSQLNIGTDDIAEYKAATGSANLAEIRVVVTNVYNSIDVMTGEVVGNPIAVTFKKATAPSQKEETKTEAFPYKKEDITAKPYEYLAMNYLLVRPAKDIVDVTMTVGDGDVYEYNNVPVQRNYRTNIYGSLLTDPTGFNVIIAPEFDDNHNVFIQTVAAENFDATKIEADKNYRVVGSVDEEGKPISTITFETASTLKPASIEFENVILETNATVTLNTPVVDFNNVVIEGTNKANTNATFKISEAETVTLTDVNINRTGSYNAFEVSGNVKEVNVSNLSYTNASHNAVSVFEMEDNAVINVTDCEISTSSGVVVRLDNKTNAKNVTVNVKNVTVTGRTVNKNRWDDAVVVLQDSYTYAGAEHNAKEGQAKYGTLKNEADYTLFETKNPFGTFTINIESVTVDGTPVTSATQKYTNALQNNPICIAAVSVNNIGSKGVDVTQWVANQHVISEGKCIQCVDGTTPWGMDLVTDQSLLPTVNVK